MLILTPEQKQFNTKTHQFQLPTIVSAPNNRTLVQCTDNMWRQNIDAIKWLIELWFGAQTICGGLNIDAIKWLIEPWFGALTVESSTYHSQHVK